jgi:acetyltransferase-like isoleucine patch superfamily enzyme
LIQGLKNKIRSTYYRSKLKKIGSDFKVSGKIEIGSGQNIRIGNNLQLSKNIVLSGYGGITIGNNVTISRDVLILSLLLDKDSLPKRVHVGKPIIIKDNCWIASRAIILAGVTIGNNSIIGAGTVVTKDVPDNCFAHGSPMKLIFNSKSSK